MPILKATSSKPAIVRTISDLRALTAAWRTAGARIALVPTMGALHDGHMSLIEQARKHADRVVVSIFVNPTQFAPTEDFEKYPRALEADVEKITRAGGDAIFAPQAGEVYPEGFSTSVTVEGPAKAGLEDTFRPEHFDGVATIVSKLHIMAAPDVAIYGEKDFQQLAVIRQMNCDLNLPVEVIGAPTVRAGDGLALSSRNAYLSAQEREIAPELHRTLCACRDGILRGENAGAALAAALTHLQACGFKPDYLALRDAQTLGAFDTGSGRPGRLLVAARLGATRLIDNIAVAAD
ncbi:MAG: pantoate--beta-alanine ligase [Hyphomicrobiales bacterium]|nr:pantoate--beta-alanine ligase [Hyphomicrobiales bacterium]